MVMKSSDTISKEMNTGVQNAECINGSSREKVKKNRSHGDASGQYSARIALYF